MTGRMTPSQSVCTHPVRWQVLKGSGGSYITSKWESSRVVVCTHNLRNHDTSRSRGDIPDFGTSAHLLGVWGVFRFLPSEKRAHYTNHGATEALAGSCRKKKSLLCAGTFTPILGDLLLHMAVPLLLCCCSQLEEPRPGTRAGSPGPALLPPWSLSPWVHSPASAHGHLM